MRDYVRLTGVLLIVCIAAAVLLGYTNVVTKDRIADQAQKESEAARKAVLCNAQQFEQLDQDAFLKITSGTGLDAVKEIYAGKTGGALVGYVVRVAPKGYGGAIDIMVGINREGKVAAIKVGNNNETPGLGKKAAEPAFQEQFAGKDMGSEIKVIKRGIPKNDEIMAIAGSTITSRAVAKGVSQALQAVKIMSQSGGGE